jgi:hypothetical protein
MFSVDKSYSSNVLFTRAFDPAQDIILSFLYTDFDTEDLGLLRKEDRDLLLLQDGSDFRLNIGRGTVDGLSVFLINDTAGTTLTGGGSATNNPGLNLITDTNVSDLSALSGIMLIAAIDKTGYFGLSSNGVNGSLEQFTTGNDTLNPDNIVIRTANRGSTITALPSTFDYKGSVPLSSYERDTIDKKFKIFTIGFKRHLQDVTIYNREKDAIEAISTFNTDIPLSNLPSKVYIGLSYSGYMPMEIKNITVNGNTIG